MPFKRAGCLQLWNMVLANTIAEFQCPFSGLAACNEPTYPPKVNLYEFQCPFSGLVACNYGALNPNTIGIAFHRPLSGLVGCNLSCAQGQSSQCGFNAL